MWFLRMRIKTIQSSNKNFILRCRDGKRTETRIGMEKEQKQELGWKKNRNKNWDGKRTETRIGMEKEQKQELGWRVSVLPIPAFHHCEPLCVACTQCRVECRKG